MAENNERNQNDAEDLNTTNTVGRDTGETVGTIGGTAVGAALGSVFGPLGTIAGAVAGGHWVTRWVRVQGVATTIPKTCGIRMVTTLPRIEQNK
ncbi:hypothetical protein J31TS6_47420 [Brevibacillus reuszeri]|uniref:hypothetical protein n=1 Tax=Brevibacillus reuszeri TaxID=54915 RepID=UPI001AFCDE73|nr:hypothetical protein J31TS6_47420 [Brevibacillus reuszeri]